VVCGRKGSGKSTYVKALIGVVDCFILFDYHIEHEALGYPTADLDAIPILWAKGIRKIVYVPTYRSVHEVERICWIAKRLRNLVLVIDECDRLVQKKAELHGTEIGELIHGGRHYGVGLITVTRRFADLHEAFISQADFIVWFNQHSKGDRKRLEDELGEEALKISQMPEYSYGEYAARTNQIQWFKKLSVS
jgi:hypothetical protein